MTRRLIFRSPRQQGAAIGWRLGVKTALASIALPALVLLGCVDGSILPGAGPDGAAGPGATGGAGGGGGGGGPAVDGRAPDIVRVDGAPPVTVGPPPTGLPTAQSCTVKGRPGPRALRRLTAAQYADSLRDLFGDPNLPTARIFNDPLVLGFTDDNSALVVRDLTSQQIMSYAETVADWAVANRLAALTGCQATPDAACAQRFVRSFGRRVFREPLTTAQAQRYDALIAGESSVAAGIQAVIAAMLQSPRFLYRRELGRPDAADPTKVVLTPHEVASALSYLLLGTTPDSALLDAADANKLSTPAELDAQVQRLLMDPRSRDGVMRFMSGWLGLGKVMTAVKDDAAFKLTDSLRQSMLDETQALILETVFGRNGTFSDLLTTPQSFLNRELVQHYGLLARFGTAIPVGAPITLVSYNATDRDPGILAHGSVLTGFASASSSSPTQRGKLVRTRLLCQSLPPPPGDVNTQLPPLGPTETTRQRSEQHTRVPACAACHSMMDPIGFGFEHYDGFGRRRDQENGQPINAAGQLIDVKEGNVPFDGLAHLARYLAASDEVKDCMIRFWSYYAFGRAAWEQDACTYDAIREDAARNNFTMLKVLSAIVRSPHFTRRVQGP